MDGVDDMDPVDRSAQKLIPKHGGYRNLKSYQIAQLVYDLTARFCDRYVDRRSRTHDQMVQAARSGAQNIAEGSQASGTSKKTEMKLTNVARASLEELKLDYQDFLRQRGLQQWSRDHPLRSELIRRRFQTAAAVVKWVEEVHQTSTGSMSSTSSSYPEIAANAIRALTIVACSLLDRQIAAQAASFEKEGGFSERLYRIRSSSKTRSP